MNKLTLAVLALVFAFLGGCVGTGELVGTGAVDTGPFPQGNEAQADG
jgi:hypothetical protein